MIGANIAPGMNRSFTAEDWTHLIPKKYWYAAIEEANDQIREDVELNIQGYFAIIAENPGNCIGCGSCFYQCPEPGAITIFEEE